MKPEDQDNVFNIIELNKRLGNATIALDEAKKYLDYLDTRGEIDELRIFVDGLKKQYTDWVELGELDL